MYLYRSACRIDPAVVFAYGECVTVMRYDNVKKGKKRDKLVMYFVIAPSIILLGFVLPLVLMDFFRKPDILFCSMMLIGAAVLAIIFISQFRVQKRLGEMCRKAGAANDDAMNELLARGAEFDGNYFVTKDCFIDFAHYCVIPRKQIRMLECTTFRKPRRCLEYWLVIRYGPDETDIVTFQNQKTRDMLYRALSYVRTDDAFQQDAPSEK